MKRSRSLVLRLKAHGWSRTERSVDLEVWADPMGAAVQVRRCICGCLAWTVDICRPGEGGEGWEQTGHWRNARFSAIRKGLDELGISLPPSVPVGQRLE